GRFHKNCGACTAAVPAPFLQAAVSVMLPSGATLLAPLPSLPPPLPHDENDRLATIATGTPKKKVRVIMAPAYRLPAGFDARIGEAGAARKGCAPSRRAGLMVTAFHGPPQRHPGDAAVGPVLRAHHRVRDRLPRPRPAHPRPAGQPLGDAAVVPIE